jgi:class 3 adenylate cyclase
VRRVDSHSGPCHDLTIGDAEDRHLVFRVGIDIGDVIVESQDIFDGGVNIAARIPDRVCHPVLYLARLTPMSGQSAVAAGTSHRSLAEESGALICRNTPRHFATMFVTGHQRGGASSR